MVAVTTMVLMKPIMLSQLSLLKDWMNSMGKIKMEVLPTATWKLLMPRMPACIYKLTSINCSYCLHSIGMSCAQNNHVLTQRVTALSMCIRHR